MIWLDTKYISLLSGRLQKFKRKSGNLYNFRCPICQDSKKKTNKARGYFYEKDNKYLFFCHNCGVSMLFENLLKMLDTSLHSEYILEKLSDQRKSVDEIWYTKKITFVNDDFALTELKKLKKISQLPMGHPARDYIEKRQIPQPYHSLFRWCPNFMTWTNTLVSGKFAEEVLRWDEGRILIPYFDQNKKLFAYQGRTILGNAQRYIYIILNYDIPRVFGLNTVNVGKNIFVFEGPIDSCFIPNSIAAGGHLHELLKITTLDKFVLCYDNEPHSIQTKGKIIKAINQGFRVCIWPSAMAGWKDVNEMVLNECSAGYIKYIIEINTFSDLMAKAKLAEWSKV